MHQRYVAKTRRPRRGYGWSLKGSKKSRREDRTTTKNPRFYAVAIGWRPGIYKLWKNAHANVKNYPKAIHKSFPTLQQARDFMWEHCRMPPGVKTPFPPAPDTPLPPDEYIYPSSSDDDDEEEPMPAQESIPTPKKQTQRKFRGNGWSRKGTKASRRKAKRAAQPTFYAVRKAPWHILLLGRCKRTGKRFCFAHRFYWFCCDWWPSPSRLQHTNTYLVVVLEANTWHSYLWLN